jgi:hypothetical protein
VAEAPRFEMEVCQVGISWVVILEDTTNVICGTKWLISILKKKNGYKIGCME